MVLANTRKGKLAATSLHGRGFFLSARVFTQDDADPIYTPGFHCLLGFLFSFLILASSDEQGWMGFPTLSRLCQNQVS